MCVLGSLQNKKGNGGAGLTVDLSRGDLSHEGYELFTIIRLAVVLGLKKYPSLDMKLPFASCFIHRTNFLSKEGPVTKITYYSLRFSRLLNRP